MGRRTKTFRLWMVGNFTQMQLRGIAAKGAGAGFPKLRTTRDCVRLFDRYADEICDLVQRAGDSPSTRLMKQWLVWFAAEEIARRGTAKG